MPGHVIDGGPSFVCGDLHGGYYPSAPVLSQLFNRDYTQIAGWVPGRGGEGGLATAFDLRTGAQVGPGPNPNTFAATPDDGRTVFHEGKLWYVDRGKRLRSRAPGEAPELAQDHGPAPNSELIFAGNDPWYGNNKFSSAHYTAVVHPSGRYAAELDHFWGNLRIRQRGAENYSGSALSEGTAAGAEKPPPGSARVPSCSPNFWLDDHTLICTSRSQIWKLTLASNLESVTNAEPLLPATDLGTYGAILAPDKLSFAFLANQGNITTVYRQSLSPGSQPVKIADVPASGSTYTYLIVWQ